MRTVSEQLYQPEGSPDDFQYELEREERVSKVTTKHIRSEIKSKMGLKESKFEYRNKKFTVHEMSNAFDAVKNPHHWKAPILAIIDEKNREVTAAAIMFYTATEMRINSRHEYDTDEVKLVIEADGYWKGPAN